MSTKRGKAKKESEMAKEKKSIRVYWDIENISPGSRGVEPFFDELYKKLQHLFGDAFTPLLITVVCNVCRTSEKMLEFLSKNGVTIIHIPGRKGEEADRKIEEIIRHDLTYSPESHFVLITHDNDFVGVLREMRHRSSKESKIVYVRRSQTGGRCTAALERLVTHTIKMETGSRSSSPVSSSSPSPKPTNSVVVVRKAVRATSSSVVVTRPACVATSSKVVVTRSAVTA